MVKQGLKAPEFTLLDQYGKKHSLSDYLGKWIILYFYPKDMTPGCTVEACNFRDEFSEFRKLDITILGISKDGVNEHKKFSKKYNLPFKLLSDKETDVCEQYGTWQKKNMYGREYMGIVRSTYLINPEGIIKKVYPKVDVKIHAQQILEEIKNQR